MLTFLVSDSFSLEVQENNPKSDFILISYQLFHTKCIALHNWMVSLANWSVLLVVVYILKYNTGIIGSCPVGSRRVITFLVYVIRMHWMWLAEDDWRNRYDYTAYNPHADMIHCRFVIWNMHNAGKWAGARSYSPPCHSHLHNVNICMISLHIYETGIWCLIFGFSSKSMVKLCTV